MDDPVEFAAIYERHRAGVYANCLRRLRSPADADDATQVIFLKAFSAIRRGTEPDRVGPWLSGIARNVCYDRLGERRELPGIAECDLPPDDGPDLDAALLAEADGLIVRSALARLPFAQRSVLHLREVDEHSYAEVSERLGLSVSAVETLLFRARANLRDEIVAARSPLDCDAARFMAARVRDGEEVEIADRKALRNHREVCSRCAKLPSRRRRTPQAALALLAGLVFGGARRLISVPAAQAAQLLTAAAEPAKLTAVALTVGGVTAGGVVVAPKVVHHTRHRAAAHAAPAPTPAERKAVASFRRPPTLGAVLPSTRRAAPQGTSDVHRVVSARPESKNESDATKERAEPRGSEPGGGDRRQQNRPRQGDGHDGSAPAAQSPSPSPNQQPRQVDPFGHDSSSAPTSGSVPDTGFPAGSSEWPYGQAADLREADVHDMQEPRRPPG